MEVQDEGIRVEEEFVVWMGQSFGIQTQ